MAWNLGWLEEKPPADPTPLWVPLAGTGSEQGQTRSRKIENYDKAQKRSKNCFLCPKFEVSDPLLPHFSPYVTFKGKAKNLSAAHSWVAAKEKIKKIVNKEVVQNRKSWRLHHLEIK